MADVTLTYKGNTIAEMSDTGTKTLKTAGKYCEGDIGVSYVKPSSGGSDDLAIKLIEGEGAITELPSGITTIGDYAFSHCNNLSITSLPNGITSIGSFAFSYCHGGFTLSSLPDSVTSIGQQSFEGTRITITTLPSGITEIPYKTFSNCPQLTSMFLSESIDVIRSYAFETSSIQSITFKGTPSNIEHNAFANCTNLTNIYVPWAEGAVSGAPWGASHATIHYNTTT